ncbi:hypothetical protein B0H13DRAFT_1875359 [Mycena leptocephala]|nr:hypothetical protein B0H13DRAFT_1875359 [Mycena leptocephala]
MLNYGSASTEVSAQALKHGGNRVSLRWDVLPDSDYTATTSTTGRGPHTAVTACFISPAYAKKYWPFCNSGGYLSLLVSKSFKLVEWILYGGHGNAVSKTPTSSAAEQRPEGESSSTTAAPSSQSKKTNRNGERKLTMAEMAQYRAEGKCFDCGSTEHIRKDCPLHNRLKPPKNHNVSSNAVSFAKIERLRNLEAQNLGVFSVDTPTPSLSTE